MDSETVETAGNDLIKQEKNDCSNPAVSGCFGSFRKRLWLFSKAEEKRDRINAFVAVLERPSKARTNGRHQQQSQSVKHTFAVVLQQM